MISQVKDQSISILTDCSTCITFFHLTFEKLVFRKQMITTVSLLWVVSQTGYTIWLTCFCYDHLRWYFTTKNQSDPNDEPTLQKIKSDHFYQFDVLLYLFWAKIAVSHKLKQYSHGV